MAERWIDEVSELVSSFFRYGETYLSDDNLVFVLEEDVELKKKFTDLSSSLEKVGFVARLLREDQKLILVISKRRPMEERRKKRELMLSAVLAITTMVIIAVDGYFRIFSDLFLTLTSEGLVWIPLPTYLILYVLSLGLILSSRWLGYILVLGKEGSKFSPPYLIPGLPIAIPTFGSIILQRAPLVNRDRMVLAAISGLALTFLSSFVLTLASLWTLVPLSTELLESLEEKGLVAISTPLVFNVLLAAFRGDLSGRALLLDPIAWSSVVASLVVFIDALPAWEFDGGRLFRALFGERAHELSSMISAIVAAVVGLLPVSILILLLWRLSSVETVLDQVSPVGGKLRTLAIIPILLLLVSLPVSLPLGPLMR